MISQTPVLHHSRLNRFTPYVWLLICGNFFIRGSFYMIWPFVAMLLLNDYHFSATDVGLLLTSAAVLAKVMSLYTGYLSDKIGRQPVMVLASVIAIVAFSMLAFANTALLFAMSVALASLPRALWDAPSKARISDELTHDEDRELAFQILYFAVNVGAAIGPLAGLWLGFSGDPKAFLLVAFLYGAFLIALLLIKNNASQVRHAKGTVSFARAMMQVSKDMPFMLIIAANTFIYFVYAQGDASLIQYLTLSEATHLVTLVSTLIFTNAMIIVLCQFPFAYLLRAWPLKYKLYLGAGLLLIAQLGYAMSSPQVFYHWVLATVVLSLGEAILFANMNIVLDKLSPLGAKGSYFAVAGMADMGFAFAPLLGGMVIQFVGGPALFLISTLITLFGMLLYRLAFTNKDPHYA